MKMSNKSEINRLRQELRYHQTMVRVDLRAVRAGVRKCKEIGQQMRDLQSGKAVEHKMQRTVGTVPLKKADPQPEVLPVSVVGTHQLPLI